MSMYAFDGCVEMNSSLGRVLKSCIIYISSTHHSGFLHLGGLLG